MKILVILLLSALYVGCVPQQEIQAEMVEATLIKVEDVKRYPDVRQKMLTWQTARNVVFITYEPEHTNLPVGTLTRVLIQK